MYGEEADDFLTDFPLRLLPDLEIRLGDLTLNGRLVRPRFDGDKNVPASASENTTRAFFPVLLAAVAVMDFFDDDKADSALRLLEMRRGAGDGPVVFVAFSSVPAVFRKLRGALDAVVILGVFGILIVGGAIGHSSFPVHSSAGGGDCNACRAALEAQETILFSTLNKYCWAGLCSM